MNILITGVNGLIGFELAKRLCLNTSDTIYGLSRSAPLIAEKNYKHISLDVEEAHFSNQLPNSVDVLIHLAQSEKFRNFPDSAIDVFKVNSLSTLLLLDYSRKSGVKKFIYASSGGVYGNKDVGFTEDSPVMGTGDLGFYLSTKLCSEILTDNYVGFFNIIQLRFFFVYGERQNKSMLIPRLFNSVKNNMPVVLTGDEGIMINPLYVSDAAKAVEAAIKLNHSDKINIGGTEHLSIKQIAEIISKQTGTMPVFEYVKGETKSLIGDITKMKNMLCVPEVSFEKGIHKLNTIIHE